MSTRLVDELLPVARLVLLRRSALVTVTLPMTPAVALLRLFALPLLVGVIVVLVAGMVVS